MVWPTLGSRKAKEQNRTKHDWDRATIQKKQNEAYTNADGKNANTGFVVD